MSIFGEPKLLLDLDDDLESLRLLNTQAAILFAPAVVGLLGYTDLSAGFRDGDTLIDVDLSFPQLPDTQERNSNVDGTKIPVRNYNGLKTAFELAA